jgi:hypothetical protein
MPDEKRGKKAFLELAMERFKLAAEAESDIREQALADLKFYSGEQWDDAIQSIRKKRGRPCLVMNHLPQFKRQICNEQRQNKPAIVVNPIGDNSDVETAEIQQGIVRHIEVNSNADVARDISFEQMVITGFGYRRIVTEYADDEGDEQEIRIKPIKDQFTVYFDPRCMEPDYSDAEFAFIIEDVPTKMFHAQYPRAEDASLEEYQAVGNSQPEWINEKHVRIAEYFYVEKPESAKRGRRKVKWAKITAAEVLEEQDWLGKYIPLIPVLGEEMIIDGKRVLKGFVRDAKHPQRQYNFMHSGAAEAIAILPKAPYILAVGQAENLEQKWERANVENFPYLEYNPVDVNGTAIGPPQRANSEANIQGYNQMIMLADNDLKASIGLYDASLGQKGPEQSGRAIAQRKQQGDLATLNFSDNQARSILHEGRVILDLMRVVYDTPRVMRIINPDGSVKQVVTQNGPSQEAAAKKLLTDQIKKIYDIGVGSYDVAVQVGPSYQSKRQEAVATQLELVKADPQLLPIIGDLLVGEMDIPGAKEIAKRLKKMLPPQLQDMGDEESQIQQLQTQHQQMVQELTLVSQHLQQAQQIIETKQVEQQGKVEIAKAQELSKQTIVKMQEVTKIAVAQINASKDAHQSYADAELKQYELLHNAAHDVALQATDQAHQQDMAAKQQAAAAQGQQADQSHDMDMAAVNQAHDEEMATANQGQE